MAVMDTLSRGRPTPVLGHSKGGSLMIQLADAQPYRFTHVVNLDGIPYTPPSARRRRARAHEDGRPARSRGWLDHRRRTAYTSRKPGTFEELAERRARMNPRLSIEWLRHLVSVGAREDADGWRWKIDPSMRFGGFGPWRPEWTLLKLPGLPMPFLGDARRRSWRRWAGAPCPSEVFPYLPARRPLRDPRRRRPLRAHRAAATGVAEMVLDFVGTRPA